MSTVDTLISELQAPVSAEPLGEQSALESMILNKEISIWEAQSRLDEITSSHPHPSWEILGEIEDLEATIINLKTEIDDLNDLGASMVPCR